MGEVICPDLVIAGGILRKVGPGQNSQRAMIRMEAGESEILSGIARIVIDQECIQGIHQIIDLEIAYWFVPLRFSIRCLRPIDRVCTSFAVIDPRYCGQGSDIGKSGPPL